MLFTIKLGSVIQYENGEYCLPFSMRRDLFFPARFLRELNDVEIDGTRLRRFRGVRVRGGTGASVTEPACSSSLESGMLKSFQTCSHIIQVLIIESRRPCMNLASLWQFKVEVILKKLIKANQKEKTK